MLSESSLSSKDFFDAKDLNEVENDRGAIKRFDAIAETPSDDAGEFQDCADENPVENTSSTSTAGVPDLPKDTAEEERKKSTSSSNSSSSSSPTVASVVKKDLKT